ncbi:MAG: putative DNA binding domain-containing protein [Chloroflexi bacterium]|nr:putative DNA binding domain-containing protein [Chloroflexota bacterium]
MLAVQQLQALINKGETNTVELKIAPPRPAELAERICGLCNAQGGYIIIGVEDQTLRLVGVKDPQAAIDTIFRACRLLNPPLTQLAEPEIYHLDGIPLVVATIPPSKGPIYQASGAFLVRRGTNTVRLSLSEMLLVANDRGLINWELQPARRAKMEDLDMEKVAAYLEMRPTRNRQVSRFNNLDEVLLGMDCLTDANDTDTEGKLCPTNAGILFFGKDPQLHIPQSEIVCVKYRDDLGLGRYIDRKIITGTLQELIDQTESFINRHMSVGAVIKGWKRHDLPEYPLEALREAVVNAVVHRDYSRAGESIRLFYYANRIEIHNPGLLLPGITIEQLERGEAPSRLRNPVLGGFLRDVPGYMERIGTGVRFMLHETQQMGLPPPQFKEVSEFVITFYKATEEVREALVEKAVQTKRTESTSPSTLNTKEVELKLTAETKETGNEGPIFSDEVQQRRTQAMLHIQHQGFITSKVYQELNEVSGRTALRELEYLVEQGTLKREGKTRSRKYLLP